MIERVARRKIVLSERILDPVRCRQLTSSYLPPSFQQAHRRLFSLTLPRFLEASIETGLRPRDLRSQLEGQNQSKKSDGRSLFGPWLFATSFSLIGLGLGQYIRLVIQPPEQPEPGSEEDRFLISQIHAQAERLPLVQNLSSDPSWRSWDAYSTFSASERPHRLTTGPLAGARGLGGYQRIFHNESTGEFISVVWIGGHVTGWPGITHGGLAVTLLDESLGRCALARFPEKTGVTANLQLHYRSPTFANEFHVIRAKAEEEGSTDRKCRTKGRLETLDGRLCVEAEGLFVVPKKLRLRVLESGF